MILSRNTIFLFLKLKFLFVTQNTIILSILIFLILNVLEMKRSSVYKRNKFLKPVYILESLNCIIMIIFFILATLNTYKIVLIENVLMDIFFIINLCFILFIPFIIKGVFLYRRVISN